MGSPVSQAGELLIQLIFGLYILAVMLRFLFQWVRADFYNPLSQALVKITNPPLVMLRRVIPGFWGIDVAAVILMWALQALEIFLAGEPSQRIPGLIHGQTLNLVGLPVAALASLISLGIWIIIIAILIRILISWISPMGGHNPINSLLFSLTEPLMSRARRIIPPISGLDLSPIAVLVVLELALILVVRPLSYFGYSLML
ncbi:MAG: YggT family protein [Gammaproteobacteria bacterium]|nr:MAG: YggT family protein [Gammaproteobacteria bacterium]